MKKRLAIAYVASVLLGMLAPLHATLAEGLQAYAESDAAQRMCQVQETQNMSLAVPSAPCTDPVEDLPCTALSGDVTRSDVNPVALTTKSDVFTPPAPTALTAPLLPVTRISSGVRGTTVLSHIHTIVLRV